MSCRCTWLVMWLTAVALGGAPALAHVPHDRVVQVQVAEGEEGVRAAVVVRGRLYRSLDGVTFERRHAGITCDKYISAVGIAPGGHVVAACKGRLFRSVDGGETFTAGGGSAGVFPQKVRLSPTFSDDKTMIINGPGARFAVSRDGGASTRSIWVRSGATAITWSGPRPLIGTKIGALVTINDRDEVVPLAKLPGPERIISIAENTDIGAAFVGTERGVVFWVDLKTGHIARLHAFPGPVVGLAFAQTPLGPRLAAVTDEAGVFVSSDGGRSFVHHRRGIERTEQSNAYGQPMFYDLALTERGGVWVGSFTGLYRGELRDLEGPLVKAGDRRFLVQPLSWGHVVGLGVASVGGEGLLANLSLYGGGLHQVVIGGEGELEVRAGHPDVALTRLGTSAASGSVVLASHYSHALVSTDGGMRWQKTRLTPARQSAHALKRRVLRGAARKMPGLHRGLQRVLIDSDEGPLDGTPIAAAISPTVDEDQTLFVGVAPNGLMRSEDLGASFAMVWGAEGETPRSIAPSPNFADDGVVWIATATDVFRSDARGRRPARCGTGDEPYRPLLAFVDDEAAGLVFLASAQGLFVSADACGEWRAIDVGASGAPIVALEPSPAFARDRTFFVQAAGRHLQRCTLPPRGPASCADLGRSFGMMPVAHRDGNDLLAVSPAYEDDGVVVAVDDATVHVSRDRGASFESVTLVRRYDVGMSGALWLHLPSAQDEGWSVDGPGGAEGGKPLVAEQAGATLSASIVGRGVRLVGDRGPDGGRFRVWMDGEVLATADSFSADRQPRVVIWSHRFEEVGRHRLRLEVLGESERRALGTRVTLHAIDVVR